MNRKKSHPKVRLSPLKPIGSAILQEAQVNINYENLRNDCSVKNTEINYFRKELENLKQLTSQVSDTEWARISEINRLQKEVEVEEKRGYSIKVKAERRHVRCSCLGLVENCSRCFGAGEYIVDGYGNVM